MISGLPVTSTPPDIANGATAPGDAPTPATPAAPFDFILALEAMAASAAAQQAAASATGATALDGAELPGEGLDADELDDDDEEGSLEFLAGLLNAATLRTADPAGAENSAATSAGAIDIAKNPDATKDPAGNAGGAAAGLASALAAVSAEQAAPDSLEPVADSGVTPTRANELLAQAPRLAHAAADQPAIATHVRDPRWAEDFGTRITTMVRGGESQAALQLTPVDLGPVDVTVTVRDSQATIHFGAAQADTRALIEASLPKLREMLAAQGFNLLDASVSQGFTQQGRSESAGVPRSGIDPIADGEVLVTRHIAGLLDLYA